MIELYENDLKAIASKRATDNTRFVRKLMLSGLAMLAICIPFAYLGTDEWWRFFVVVPLIIWLSYFFILIDNLDKYTKIELEYLKLGSPYCYVIVGDKRDKDNG